jgi:ubiquinone/menaquinone biosynthesis C-methylase UbiE
LQRGAKVADVGCGHGVSTAIMAQAFPNSQFIGYDSHPDSIAHAETNAREGVSANARFEVATAKDYPGKDFDLVTFFDCLHDMGDPAGAAAHVRQSLKKDGTWMVIEPMAGDRPRRQSEPVRPVALRWFDARLRADIIGAGSRCSAWWAGRRGQVARGHY